MSKEVEVEVLETKEIKVNLSNLTEAMTTVLATAEPIINLTKEYLQLEKGKPQRFLFSNVTEVADTNTGEMSKAVVFINEKRELFITRSIVILNACKDLNSFAGVELEYLGEKALDGGKKLKKYRVTLLNN